MKNMQLSALALVFLLLVSPTTALAQTPLRLTTTALTQDPADLPQPAPAKRTISRARKIWGGLLVGAGAYYLASAIVADAIDLPEYRPVWTVMGVSLSAAGVAVLLTGRQNSPAPSVTLGPKRLTATWTVTP